MVMEFVTADEKDGCRATWLYLMLLQWALKNASSGKSQVIYMLRELENTQHEEHYAYQTCFCWVKSTELTCKNKRSCSAPGGSWEPLGETARLKSHRLPPLSRGAQETQRESKLTLQLDEPSNVGQEPSGQSAGSKAAGWRCWASYSLSCHERKRKVETEAVAGRMYRAAESTLGTFFTPVSLQRASRTRFSESEPGPTPCPVAFHLN